MTDVCERPGCLASEILPLVPHYHWQVWDETAGFWRLFAAAIPGAEEAHQMRLLDD